MGRLTIATLMLLAASSLTPESVAQESGGRKAGIHLTDEQRRQYEQCLGAVERLQAEVRALSTPTSRPEPSITTYAKHRSEIRLAAISVRKCHAIFSASLTQEQRTGTKEVLLQLNHAWSGILRHFLALDDDLNQHQLDSGRLMLHVQELNRLVDEYVERYRKLGAYAAALRRSLPPHTRAPQPRFALATSETMNLAALTRFDQI